MSSKDGDYANAAYLLERARVAAPNYDLARTHYGKALNEQGVETWYRYADTLDQEDSINALLYFERAHEVWPENKKVELNYFKALKEAPAKSCRMSDVSAYGTN